ncbi:MAG: hypothetical protein IPH57_05070 [Saprospiraceae bacterium]|nr:hypothetical protein [Saprospiraceae bacterium]
MSLANNITEKAKDIDKLKNEKKVLIRRIDSLTLVIKEKSSTSEKKEKPKSVVIIDSNKFFLDDLQKKLKDLNKQYDYKKIENARLKQEKRNAIREIEKLRRDTSVLAIKLKKANEIIKFKNDTISYYRNVLVCIDKFNQEKEEISDEVNAKLMHARQEFERYSKLNRVEKSNNEQIIHEIINTYERYKGNLKTSTCGEYKLSYFKDNLIAKDYLIIAKIYGYNLGNAINQLGENKVNKATEQFLISLGFAIGNGFYDDKAESEKLKKEADIMIENIGSLAIIVKDKSFDLANKFQDIIDYYKKDQFYEALINYDKYSKYINLDEMIDYQSLVNEAQYCVGAILLWKLYDFNYQPLTKIFHNQWAEGYDNQRELGDRLLNDLSKMKANDSQDILPSEKTIDRELKKKSIIAIKKLYE